MEYAKQGPGRMLNPPKQGMLMIRKKGNGISGMRMALYVMTWSMIKVIKPGPGLCLMNRESSSTRKNTEIYYSDHPVSSQLPNPGLIIP